MRNIYSFLLLIVLLNCAVCVRAQEVYIPDASFRAFLRQQFPSCMNGDKLMTQCDEVVNAIYLNVDNRGIASLAGIEHFVNLQELYCANNKLEHLPALPSTIMWLYCVDNPLQALPALPVSLRRLWCDRNHLTQLPALPASLVHLSCRENLLTSLPALPAGMRGLFCDQNKLTALPALPAGLNALSCSDNLLTMLPAIPGRVSHIWANNNKLVSLPALPASLIALGCHDNKLTTLPSLPALLRVLGCNNNLLNTMPVLPASLLELYCSGNQLSILPSMPSSLRWLACGRNDLSFEDLEPNMYLQYHKYAPQNAISLLPAQRNISPGATLSLTVSTGGSANRYRWFRNGAAISALSDSPDFNKSNCSINDAGVYTCQVTSMLVPNLTLTSTPVTVQVGPPCIDKPCNLQALVNMTTAWLNWDFSPDAVRFGVRYRVKGTTTWTFRSSITRDIKLASLQPGVVYEWQVRAVYSENPLRDSEYSDMGTFKTSLTTVCRLPYNLNISSVGSRRATVSWQHYGEGNLEYEIHYMPTGTNQWLVARVSSTSKTLHELASGQQYEWKVRAICNGNSVTEFVTGQNFMTLGDACDMVSDPMAVASETSAILSWQPVPGVVYTVQYRAAGTTQWRTRSSTTNGMRLIGLKPATTYEWRIRTDCGNNQVSPYSSNEMFTTTEPGSGGRSEVLAATAARELKLYPNPSEGAVFVEYPFDESTEQAELQVYDALGKLVYQHSMTRDQSSVQLLLPSRGMYIARVTGNQQTLVKRFVVQ